MDEYIEKLELESLKKLAKLEINKAVDEIKKLASERKLELLDIEMKNDDLGKLDYMEDTLRTASEEEKNNVSFYEGYRVVIRSLEIDKDLKSKLMTGLNKFRLKQLDIKEFVEIIQQVKLNLEYGVEIENKEMEKLESDKVSLENQLKESNNKIEELQRENVKLKETIKTLSQEEDMKNAM